MKEFIDKISWLNIVSIIVLSIILFIVGRNLLRNTSPLIIWDVTLAVISFIIGIILAILKKVFH